MDFRKDIVKIVNPELRKMNKKLKIDESFLKIPPGPELGDYALPCFAFSKEIKRSPNEIAQELVRKISLKQPISRIDVKGPYVNFFINRQRMAEIVLQEIFKEKSRYGATKRKKEIVMIEFPSPNTNKPLHLGHIRNMVIGDSMSRIYKFCGSRVIKANLNNDRGIHICKSMLAYKKFGDGAMPDKRIKKTDHFVGDFYVKFNEEAKNNPALEEEGKEMLKKWEQGDKETIKLWKLMNTWAYEGFEETYARLGMGFDKYYYESDFYDKGKKIVLNGLKKKKFKKDKDGAIIAELEKYGLPNKVVLRSDGTSLYITQDIYLAIKKFKDYKLDRSIYVVANEQDLHFKQLFKILEILGYKWAKRCYHLSYGMVYLPHGRMKSREGTVVDADDLIDEMVRMAKNEINKRHENLSMEELDRRAEIIGIGAIKFYFANVDPARDMVYDPDKSISFDGETGPYVQYTYARICSILRKYAEEYGNAEKIAGKIKEKAGKKAEKVKINCSLFNDEKELDLIAKLNSFPFAVEDAITKNKPSAIANYLIKLCQSFNTFYQFVPVLKADKELRETRMSLIMGVKQIIENGLNLLGIDYLEEM
ncbi:MAG: arginine--tRNA ligase [Candidatus Woesearchaeota archaeon]|nr:arginine--tRNA ligase [Candidatus Woesearchaeota archaeon]